MDKDIPVIPPPSDNMSMGEIDASADDEDTENGIEALIKEADTACANLPAGSEQKYFKKCCEDALDQELELLPYSQMLLLKKAINIFINTADNSDNVLNVVKNQQKYVSYCVSDTEWDLLTMIQKVLAVAADVQEAFLAEYYPTVWQILLLYEDSIIWWQTFSEDPKMAVLQ
ncbi:hypothetical protein BDR04DRAFT_1161279 [Suillus decipiens]|nr:hypothetical protein BDR04DRAFT_1161279 [Suillus decipiens]